ncbi:MaoC family dehydratase [Microbacterium terrisoli]|jgi:acyl dehydratase|uniref:MaoC family dehydratase n=1 Tax=Microbacterium terrisoli TaxID=3242192 RepID=UPI00280491FB|nr:MaoC family dehydratase [Microbacterium protaetiae]
MPENMISATIDELPQLQGSTFGPSDWRTVPQSEVDLYAQLSGDDNPIHVDADFAAATPFGGRIAHGLLTVSVAVPLLRQVFRVTGMGMGINYGMNRLRFPAPVPAGSRIRIAGRVAEVTVIDGGLQATVVVEVEVEGNSKPACVAELVLRYYR